MKAKEGESKNPRDRRKQVLNQMKQGETIAGKYEVIQQVGQGVSSVVMKARNIKTNEIVAIKKIKSFLTNLHESTRVLREMILLRNLKHPNIIQLKEVIVE